MSHDRQHDEWARLGPGRDWNRIRNWAGLLFLLVAVTLMPVGLQAAGDPAKVVIGPVPDDVQRQFQLSGFYRKHVDADGFAILSSGRVSDYALREAYYIIENMLRGREDIRRGLIESRFRCGVMAADEFTTDIPEHSDLIPRNFWDRRARGLGPTLSRPAVTCGAENLLQLPGDPYQGENILVHEFAHAVHEALRVVDPGFDDRLMAVYQSALKKGLWKGKYAASNHYEYFGECVQSYFDDNRENDASHNHVNTRQELFEYDPDVARLIDETFRQNSWRYVPPDKRKEPGHLKGFDRSRAGQFAWPDRIKEATKKKRQKRAGSSIEHVGIDVEGWTVQADIQLLEGYREVYGRRVMEALRHKLREIVEVLPEKRVRQLQTITIYIDREHPRLKAMQYHPSRRWLESNGHDPDMARTVHIPQSRPLVTAFSANQQPWALMHELAHAYHDQFLGFKEPRIGKAWEAFKASGKYDRVLHVSGSKRRHYALTDQKEFFAEMTEALLGMNDFYPFVRGELKQAEPELYQLMKEIWGL